MLAAAAVLLVAGTTVVAVVAVQRSALELLDQVAIEEAAGSAASVAGAIDERVTATTEALDRLASDSTVTDGLAAGDPGVCQVLSNAVFGEPGIVVDSAGTTVCSYGPADPAERAAIDAWVADLGDDLVSDGETTTIRFSPPSFPGTVVTATDFGDFRAVHWMSRLDSLLKGFAVRLGPNNLVLAFTPTDAQKPEVVIDLSDAEGDVRGVHSAGGVDVPAGRGVGPLDVEAYWAQARTTSGAEAVAIGVDPAAYDRERERLGSDLAVIAAVIAAVTLLGVGVTLWWASRSVRRLGDAVDGACDGVIEAPLPLGGPRETQRIAAALTRLADTQVQSEVAAERARADERSRVVTALDVDVAATLDEINAALAAGASIEEFRVELDAVVERLRDVVAMLHPTDLGRLGLRSEVESQVGQRPGWVLDPGAELDMDPLVAGLLYSILAELWYRNPTGSISLRADGHDVSVDVAGVQWPTPNRWTPPVMSMGGRIAATADHVTITVPAHVEEFAQ